MFTEIEREANNLQPVPPFLVKYKTLTYFAGLRTQKGRDSTPNSSKHYFSISYCVWVKNIAENLSITLYLMYFLGKG